MYKEAPQLSYTEQLMKSLWENVHLPSPTKLPAGPVLEHIAPRYDGSNNLGQHDV